MEIRTDKVMRAIQKIDKKAEDIAAAMKNAQKARELVEEITALDEDSLIVLAAASTVSDVVKREIEAFLVGLGGKLTEDYKNIILLETLHPMDAAGVIEAIPEGEIESLNRLPLRFSPREVAVRAISFMLDPFEALKNPLLTEEDLEVAYDDKAINSDRKAMVMAHPNIGETLALRILKKSQSVVGLFTLSLNPSVSEEIREAALTKGLSIAEKRESGAAILMVSALNRTLQSPNVKNGRVTAKIFDVIEPFDNIQPFVIMAWNASLRGATPIPADVWNEKIGSGKCLLLNSVAHYFGFPKKGEREGFFKDPANIAVRDFPTWSRGRSINVWSAIEFGDRELAEIYLDRIKRSLNDIEEDLRLLASIITGRVPRDLDETKYKDVFSLQGALSNPNGLKAVTEGILESKGLL
jgi:hypothetical protein